MLDSSAVASASPCPLFVDLRDANVTVVGAGRVAERKIEMLLSHGANITVIAPQATEAIQKLADDGRIDLSLRAYRSGDLASALLVVCATNVSEVNEAVYQEAQSNNQLVNVVDVPSQCNVIVPSVLRRGRLQIAVSTGGAAPSIARDIRRGLEEEFDESWEAYLDLLAEVRCLVKARVSGPASVRKPLYEALGTANLRERLADGESLSAEQVYQTVVEPLMAGER